MNIKTSELTGAALDWAVAKCEGVVYHGPAWTKYSTDWSQGGPLIEENEIGTKRRAPCMRGEEWEASPSITAKGSRVRWAYGPTPLVAAMRSLLPEWVEVPEELL